MKLKFKNFINKVRYFFKLNFKKISFSFVAVLSALIIFCVPVSAATNYTYRISPPTGLYATNSSIREGDLSGDNWGYVLNTVPFKRQYWQSIGSRKSYYEVIYDKLENSYQLQNKYLVTTFQLLSSDKIVLQSNKTYKVTFALFFKMATDKVLETDFLKFTFWDINDNSHSPYLNFFDYDTYEWNSKYDSILGGYVSKHTFYLKNDKGKDISPTHLRFGIRFKSTLKLWQGNSWGFYDYILIEESHFTIKPGTLYFENGLKALKNLFGEVFDNSSFLYDLVQFSISLGVCAIIVGFIPSVVSSYTHSRHNSSKNSKKG